MATTGSGPGSTGRGTKESGATGQQSGQQRDRRPAGESTSSTTSASATTASGTTGLGATGSTSTGGSTTGSTSTGGNGGAGIAQTLRDTTYRSIDGQKERASETLGSLAGAVRGMTQPLRDGGQTQIADYVNKAADGIERWASNLRQQDLEDAIRAVEQFARRQPAMFLGLAFGAGLVAARFLKSSSRYDEERHYRRFDTGTSGMSGAGAYGTGTGSGSYGTGSYGTSGSAGTTGSYGTGSTGTMSGDTPRTSTTSRSSGEVL